MSEKVGMRLPLIVLYKCSLCNFTSKHLLEYKRHKHRCEKLHITDSTAGEDHSVDGVDAESDVDPGLECSTDSDNLHKASDDNNNLMEGLEQELPYGTTERDVDIRKDGDDDDKMLGDGTLHTDSTNPKQSTPNNRSVYLYQCKLCDLSTYNSRVFLFHQVTKHEAKYSIYSCEYCEYSSYCKSRVLRHLRNVHKLVLTKLEPAHLGPYYRSIYNRPVCTKKIKKTVKKKSSSSKISKHTIHSSSGKFAPFGVSRPSGTCRPSNKPNATSQQQTTTPRKHAEKLSGNHGNQTAKHKNSSSGTKIGTSQPLNIPPSKTPVKCREESPADARIMKHEKSSNYTEVVGYIKPFMCSVCGLKSNYKANIKLHIKRIHTCDNAQLIELVEEGEPVVPDKKPLVLNQISSPVLILSDKSRSQVTPKRTKSSQNYVDKYTPTLTVKSEGYNNDNAPILTVKSESYDRSRADMMDHDKTNTVLNTSTSDKVEKCLYKPYKCNGIGCSYRSNLPKDVRRHFERIHYSQSGPEFTVLDPETAQATLANYSYKRHKPSKIALAKRKAMKRASQYDSYIGDTARKAELATKDHVKKATTKIVKNAKKTHTGTKTTYWKCRFCSYVSGSRWSLFKHLMKHDTKAFECTECELTSHYRGTIEKHIESVHSMIDRSNGVFENLIAIEKGRPLVISPGNISLPSDSSIIATPTSESSIPAAPTWDSSIQSALTWESSMPSAPTWESSIPAAPTKSSILAAPTWESSIPSAPTWESSIPVATTWESSISAAPTKSSILAAPKWESSIPAVPMWKSSIPSAPTWECSIPTAPTWESSSPTYPPLDSSTLTSPPQDSSKLTSPPLDSSKHRSQPLEFSIPASPTFDSSLQANKPEVRRGKKLFKCSICPYVTKSQRGLKVHLTRHQMKPGLFKCDYCPYYLKTKKYLLKEHMHLHMTDTLPEKAYTYECKFCPYKTDISRAFLDKHEMFHYMRPDAKYICDKCNFYATRKIHLDQHMKVHDEDYLDSDTCSEPNVDCSLQPDEDIPPTNESTNTDAQAKHGVDDSQGCTVADFRLDGTGATDRSKQLYKCDMCTYTCSARASLLSHLRNHMWQKVERDGGYSVGGGHSAGGGQQGSNEGVKEDRRMVEEQWNTDIIHAQTQNKRA